MHEESARYIKEMTLANHSPLVSLNQEIAHKLNQPKSYRVSETGFLTFPQKGTLLYPDTIDRKKQQLILCHERFNPETKADELHLDFVDYNSLVLKKRLVFPDLAGHVELNMNNVDTQRKLRNMIVLDDDHLALGLADGNLRIIRTSDGSTINQARIGGTIASMDYAAGMLAASLFPAPDIKDDLDYLGVKVFSVENLISGKPFELVHSINPHFFGVLPRCIRFTQDASAFICIEGMMLSPGFTNIVERVDFKGTSKQTLFREDDRNLAMELSEINAAGTFCLATKDAYSLINPEGELIYQGALPDELHSHDNIECFFSPIGDRCILKAQGRFYLSATGEKFQRFFQELGYISLVFFLDNETVVCLISNGQSYDLAIIDLKTKTLLKCFSQPTTLKVEPISEKAFDVAQDGTLGIGDCQGNLRVFPNDLSSHSVLPTRNGNIRQILRNPGSKSMAVLWYSQKVDMFYPDEMIFRPHTSRYTNKPFEAGCGWNAISFDSIDERPWRWVDETCISVAFGCGRYVYCTKGSKKCLIRTFTYQKDPVKDNTENHLDFTFHSPASGSADLHDHAAVLLEDGTLCRIDPQNFEGLPEALPTSLLIISPEPIKGMHKISDCRVAVWTEKTMTVHEINEKWECTVCEKKDIAGIKNIKWDPIGKRFIIAFDYYLGFYSEQLQEMYRLYLLTGGEHLIHVPYPANLKTGLSKTHPGYFWCSSSAGRDLLEVLDFQGKKLPNLPEKDLFLDDYNNEFMVREALANYKTFTDNLAGGYLNMNRPVFYLPIS